MACVHEPPAFRPLISLIMVDVHADLGPMLRALGTEAMLDRAEAVLVTDQPDSLVARYPELGAFSAVTTTAAGGAQTTGQLMAAGIRAANAPLVAFCEDHVLPEPGWIQARLTAHAAGAAVVGGVLRNANPASAVSWAVFLQAFGPFAAPTAGGRSRQLAWHQCSYVRELLPLGGRLDFLLETEGLLHAELAAAGNTLVVAADCVVSHVNPSRPRSLVAYAWNGGRVWGAARSAHGRWPVRQRVWHVLLTPHTIRRELRSRRADLDRVILDRRRSIAPVLALAIVLHALGEATGVLLGDRGAATRLADIELNRRAHLISADLTP